MQEVWTHQKEKANFVLLHCNFSIIAHSTRQCYVQIFTQNMQRKGVKRKNGLRIHRKDVVIISGRSGFLRLLVRRLALHLFAAIPTGAHGARPECDARDLLHRRRLGHERRIAQAQQVAGRVLDTRATRGGAINRAAKTLAQIDLHEEPRKQRSG